MASITVYPSSYDTTNYSYESVDSSYPLSNAAGKGSDNTTYAQWDIKTGSDAESYVFYLFDLSDIPESATINSVSCTAKAIISSTLSTRISAREVQLYHGTSIAKGSATTVSSLAISTLTLTCGTWTREELNDCRIRIYTKRGTSGTSTSYYNRFYGATLTVEYTYNDVNYVITTSCNSGGTISPLGNKQVSQGSNFLLTITPDSGYDLKTINLDGTDVTSSAVRKVSYYEYNLNNVEKSHTIAVVFDANSTTAAIYIKENGEWVAYANVYKKIGGSWVLQSDITSVFNMNTNYVKGS